jgi:DNA-directed RNA polymerase subunit M/transcription elongation factor TFIIS
MENLRKSVIHLLVTLFTKYTKTKDANKDANKFELELYILLSHSEYINTAIKLHSILKIQDGYFAEDMLCNKYVQNKINVNNILTFDLSDTYTDPRDITTKLFVLILFNSSECFRNNKSLVFEIAKKIEKSCYNCVIKNCKQTDDPPCRQWNSTIFKEMYSIRCGIIYNLINPNSTTNKIYKCNLLQQIIDNTIDLDTLGYKTENELCPKSTENEKNEILLRFEQHVIEKESNLFKCPNCKERRVTYREVQLRSIDESPDYLCKCLNCNHKFTGRN